MGGKSILSTRFNVLGAVMVVLGTSLLSGIEVASAASPTISFTPTTPVGPPPASLGVFVSGSGFKASTDGALFECSNEPGQPTIDVMVSVGKTTVDLGQIPVSCSSPIPVKTNASGNLPSSAVFAIGSGVLGPPSSGTDSARNSAATDAQAYPCPPTTAQTSASCELMYVDVAGQSATAPVHYTFHSSTTTTTLASSTTTTTAPCNAQSKSETATNPKTGASATLTVDPATCLVGGQTVTVTASGLAPGSIGSLLECNSDSSQPTVSFSGTAIPVSCTKVQLLTTSATGSIPASAQSFTIVEGVTGPPTTGTDSSGADATTDASKYPCPPTAPQVTAGGTCVVAIGDLGGDQVIVPIQFNPGAPPTTTTTGSATLTQSQTESQTGNSSSTASTASLAFTGPGTLLWMLGLLGVVFVVLGGSFLLLADGPRRLVFATIHRVSHRPD